MRGYHALDDDWASSFRDSGRHWLRWLHTGDGPMLWSGGEAVDVLRFALAAYASSEAGGAGVDPGRPGVARASRRPDMGAGHEAGPGAAGPPAGPAGGAAPAVQRRTRRRCGKWSDTARWLVQRSSHTTRSRSRQRHRHCRFGSSSLPLRRVRSTALSSSDMPATPTTN